MKIISYLLISIIFTIVVIGCIIIKPSYFQLKTTQENLKNYLNSKNIQELIRNYEEFITDHADMLTRGNQLAFRDEISQKAKTDLFILDERGIITAYSDMAMASVYSARSLKRNFYLPGHAVRIDKSSFVIPSKADMEDDIEDIPDKIRIFYSYSPWTNETHIISKDMFREVKRAWREKRIIKSYKAKTESFLMIRRESFPKIVASHSIKVNSAQAQKLSALLDSDKDKNIIYSFTYWNNSFGYFYTQPKVSLEGNIQIEYGHSFDNNLILFHINQLAKYFKRSSNIANYSYNMVIRLGSSQRFKPRIRWVSKEIHPLRFVFDIFMNDEGVVTLNIFEESLSQNAKRI